jgi:hypothetical protein
MPIMAPYLLPTTHRPQKRANKQAKEEEEKRLLMEEAIKTPLKDKDKGKDTLEPLSLKFCLPSPTSTPPLGLKGK